MSISMTRVSATAAAAALSLGLTAAQAQLYAPMPTALAPTTFEHYDRNGNGVIDQSELAVYGITAWDGGGDISGGEWDAYSAGWYDAPVTAGWSWNDINASNSLSLTPSGDFLVQDSLYSVWDTEPAAGGDIADDLYYIFDYDRDTTVDPYAWYIFVR